MEKAESIVRRTFRISITEGIFSQIYQSLTMIGSGFVVKLLVILQANPFHFSILSAIGQVSQVFQTLGVAFTYRLPERKGICIKITAAGRFLTFFLGLGLFFTVRNQGIWFSLGLLFLSASLLSIGSNIWIAWISDIIPLSLRGRFFSRRNQVLLFCGMIAGYIFSYLTDLFDLPDKAFGRQVLAYTRWSGFFVPQNQRYFLSGIFVLASALALFGLYILSFQPERKRDLPEEPLKKVYGRPFRNPNFIRLLVFGSWWMLAIGIGSAFWAPFMLKKLQLSLFQMQLYGTIHMLASLFAFRFWGRFVDFHGNKTAMKICILLGGFNPLLWLTMTAQQHTIIWFEALLSGFMWAGVGIVSTNFVLSLAEKGQEQVYSGIYGAICGVSMMTSTLLTGLFYPGSMTIAGKYLEPEQVIFGIGGLVRWTTMIPLILVYESKEKPLRYLWKMMLFGFRQRLISLYDRFYVK